VQFLDSVYHWFALGSHWSGPSGVLERSLLQIELSAAVVAAAGLFGVSIGFVLGHLHRGGFVAVNAANAARAVPSLALLTLLVIFPPISLKDGGNIAAFLALFALAVPPVLTNAYIGMREVDPEVNEAGRAVGMSSLGRFFRLEVPLAAPLAVAGLRTAAVEVVATSTLAAYVSVNDLGIFIFAGLNTNNTVEMFSVALIVALLSGLTDLVLRGCYRLVSPAVHRQSSAYRARARGVVRGVRTA
jgi:osmoprotectant transport system permease protein